MDGIDDTESRNLGSAQSTDSLIYMNHMTQITRSSIWSVSLANTYTDIIFYQEPNLEKDKIHGCIF